jgi:hypothetical protein
VRATGLAERHSCQMKGNNDQFNDFGDGVTLIVMLALE